MPGIVAYFGFSLFIGKGDWGVLQIAEGEGKGCDAGMQNHPLRELTFKGCSTRPNVLSTSPSPSPAKSWPALSTGLPSAPISPESHAAISRQHASA